MARNVDPFEALTEKWEPEIRKAFLAAIAEIRDKASIEAIAEQIRRGNIEDAIRAVGIDPVNFRLLDQAIQAAFNNGGAVFGQAIPAIRDGVTNAVVQFYFDIRNTRAEAWARDRSATLVTGIITDQQVAIRASIVAGLEAGINPRTAALDLVGRRSPATGLREGGIVGLTSGQEQWQRNYAAEISSTDTQSLRAALQRGLRDKRFDRDIRKAIATGEPIPAATQAKMLAQYRNASLKHRGVVISRNESIKALGASQHEAYQQAIDKGQIEADQIKRFWVTAGDERVRHTHRLIPGMNKEGRGWYEPFQTPTGPTMHAPSDEPLCRCREKIRLNFFKDLR